MTLRSLLASFAECLESRILLANESLDVFWGTGGMQAFNGGAIDVMFPLEDGKLFAFAETADHTAGNMLKFNFNGSLDSSFGFDEGIGPELSMGYLDVHSGVQLADGSMFITGGNEQGLFVARFGADGYIDSSFGKPGVFGYTAPVAGANGGWVAGNHYTQFIGGIAVQSGGRILAASADERNGSSGIEHYAIVVGFTSTGQLDTSFANNGKAEIPLDGAIPHTMVSLADDSVLVAGKSNLGPFIAHLLADGSLDTNFGENGIARYEFVNYENDEIYSLKVLDNGDILAGGISFNSTHSVTPLREGTPVIMRVNSDGSWDYGFGGGTGLTFLNPEKSGASFKIAENIIALDLTDDGRIVAAARQLTGTPNLMTYFLNADGSPDTSVSSNGKLRYDTKFTPGDIAIDVGGRILLSGAGDGNGLIARFSEPEPVQLGNDQTLYIRGDDAGDIIHFRDNGQQFVLEFRDQEHFYDHDDIIKLDVDAKAGDDRISVSVNIDTVIRPGAGNDEVITSIGDDQITEPETNSGDDTIRSSDGDDSVYAGDGNDRINGGSGRSTLLGGAGNDRIVAGNGNIFIDAGAGDDWISSGEGRSTIHGGAGNDNIDANTVQFVFAGPDGLANNIADNDTILVRGGKFVIVRAGSGGDEITVLSKWFTSIGGGPGADTITTASGKDSIDGAGGDDIISSGPGNDWIGRSWGRDSIETGSGDDYVNISVQGTETEPDVISTSSGNDSVYLGSGSATPGGSAQVFGGSGNDYINALPQPGIPDDPFLSVSLYGHNGDDTLIGSAGRDLLIGGSGNDLLRGYTGADMLRGGDGSDTLFAGGGNDYLDGGNDHDTLFGERGNDRLFASDSFADLVDGGVAADVAEVDELDRVRAVEP